MVFDRLSNLLKDLLYDHQHIQSLISPTLQSPHQPTHSVLRDVKMPKIKQCNHGCRRTSTFFGGRDCKFLPERAKRSGKQMEKFLLFFQNSLPNKTDFCPIEGGHNWNKVSKGCLMKFLKRILKIKFTES